MTVIKSRHFIFGGFASVKLNQNFPNCLYDSKAFTFSLVNAYNTPVKMSIVWPQYAICSFSDRGPSFGADIWLPDNSNITACNSGIYHYQLPSFLTDSFTVTQSFFTGSFRFQTDEIEVYALDVK